MRTARIVRGALRRPVLTVAAALVTVALAACGGSGATATPAAATPAASAAATATGTATAAAAGTVATGGKLTPITVMLNWTPNNHHAGIYIAKANGWYAQAGLDVSIVEPSEAGTEAVVAAGKAQFGVSQAESVIPARAQGLPIVSIATILPHNDSSLIALSSTGIQRPKDLDGKTYGAFGGALEKALIDQLVSCDGGDPSTIKFVDVGNADYISGMQQGRYDFVWVFEGWDSLRARDILHASINSIKFIDYTKCIPDWYTPLIITNESMIQDHPDIVKAFLAATARGYDVAIQHPDQAAAALLQGAPELDKALVTDAATYYASRYADPGKAWGVQDPAIWQNFEAFLEKNKVIDSPVDVSKAFTNDFLPKP
jgi:ABC-type nitrate/sulfonate/bicarbonate transport system substrate-binding protein